jgi:hypothetical protein
MIDPDLEPLAVHLVRSYTAEVDWLPVVGPTSLWLARRIALLAEDHEVVLDLETLGALVGVNADRCSRGLDRLQRFHVGAWLAPDLFVVAARWPPPAQAGVFAARVAGA